MTSPQPEDLSADRVRAALGSTRFREVEVHAEVDSTQRLLVSQGGRDGRVVVADHQTAGRGRQRRSWVAPPGTSLLFSALLRGIPPAEAPLVGLACGVAVARAIHQVRPRLKWPNDVQVGGRKVAGMLGELSGDAAYVVVGVGINVRQTPEQLPPDTPATSLAAHGVTPRRDELLATVLRELDALIAARSWMDEYRALCSTIGTRVRVSTPNGLVAGTAEAVNDHGGLVVDGTVITAGDVLSVRPQA